MNWYRKKIGIVENFPRHSTDFFFYSYRVKFSTVTIEKKSVPWKIFHGTDFFTVPIRKDPIPIRKDPIPIGMGTVPITIYGNDWLKRRKRFTVPITIYGNDFLG